MASKGIHPSVLQFQEVEKITKATMLKQQEDVKALYSKWAKDINKEAMKLDMFSTERDGLIQLQMSLENQAAEIGKEIKGITERNMYLVASSVVEGQATWFESFGISTDKLSGAFQSIPNEVVKKLSSGDIYKSGWSLDKRIWSDSQDTMKDIYTVVAEGIAKNLPLYDIAKNLESYVNPNKRLPWNFKAPDGRRIMKKKVDYNAQRLARTLVQHSYQQSFQETTRHNPLIESYRWISNGSRVCPVCLEMDGMIFAKGELPMDHPNGMCTMEAVVTEGYVERLNEWFRSEVGSDPELDKFAEAFGFKRPNDGTGPPTSNAPTGNVLIDHVINSNAKSVTEWKNQMWKSNLFDVVHKFEVEAKASGLPAYKYFNKWHNKSKAEINAHLGKAGPRVATTKSKLPDPDTWIGKMFDPDEFDAFRSLENEVFNHLTSAQVTAIKDYTGSGFEYMNHYFRERGKGVSKRQIIDDTGLTPGQLRKINHLQDAFDNPQVALKKDVVLRRGGTNGDIAGLFMDGDYHDNKQRIHGMSIEEISNEITGRVGQFTGATSTSSMSDRGFFKEVETIIYAPKGSKAMSITNISNFGDEEAEVLLAPGTKVRVVKVVPGVGGNSVIRMFVELLD